MLRIHAISRLYFTIYSKAHPLTTPLDAFGNGRFNILLAIHSLGLGLELVALLIAITYLLTLHPLELFGDIVVHMLIRLFLFAEALGVIGQDDATTNTVTVMLLVVSISLTLVEVAPCTYRPSCGRPPDTRHRWRPRNDLSAKHVIEVMRHANRGRAWCLWKAAGDTVRS